MKRSLHHRRSGFTLLEIMLVVTIIVLLLGAAIFKMSGNVDVARATRATGDISTMETQLMVYSATQGFYPTTEQGLEALVTRPSNGSPTWRKLMEEVPNDPWGLKYNYVSPGVHNPEKYDLFSAGPDRKPGTADDIGNWKAK